MTQSHGQPSPFEQFGEITLRGFISWSIGVAAIGLMSTGVTNAALVDFGTYTTDNVSGLDWLDLTESSGLSYNEVASQFGAGGQFDGWRYATRSEVEVLVVQFGLPIINWLNADTELYREGIDLGTAYLGNTMSNHPNGSFSGFRGIIEEDTFIPEYSGLHFPIGAYTQLFGAEETVLTANTTYATGNDTAYVWEGHYLVRTAVVPAPSAVFLFSSALGGLGWMRRRSR